MQAPIGFDVALYVCGVGHTSPVLSTGVDFFSEALTRRWNLVSRVTTTNGEVLPGGGARSLLPALYSQQVYQLGAAGTTNLLRDTTAIGLIKTGETFTIVVVASRTGGLTFDAGTFANQPRLSGAGGTDILRFYTDAAGKLFCWSDGQGLVGGTSTTAAAGSGDTFAALTYAASIALDFNAATVQTLAATGNVAFAASLNVAQLKTKELYITNTTGADITLSCPAGWKFALTTRPTVLAAGKEAVLTLRSLSTTDTAIKAAYAVLN